MFINHSFLFYDLCYDSRIVGRNIKKLKGRWKQINQYQLWFWYWMCKWLTKSPKEINPENCLLTKKKFQSRKYSKTGWWFIILITICFYGILLYFFLGDYVPKWTELWWYSCSLSTLEGKRENHLSPGVSGHTLHTATPHLEQCSLLFFILNNCGHLLHKALFKKWFDVLVLKYFWLY